LLIYFTYVLASVPARTNIINKKGYGLDRKLGKGTWKCGKYQRWILPACVTKNIRICIYESAGKSISDVKLENNTDTRFSSV